MTMPLALWLKERHDALAVCWQHSNSTSNGVYEPADDWLPAIYRGLVAAAEGTVAPFEELMQQLRPADQSSLPPLHTLIQAISQLRRHTWGLLYENGRTSGQSIMMLEEIELLFDQAVIAITCRWEEVADATLQERVSQAEFIAESLAQATEESDQAALQLSMLNEMVQHLAAILDRDQAVALVGDRLNGLFHVKQLTIWLVEEQTLQLARWYGETEPAVQVVPLDNKQHPDDLLQRVYQSCSLLFDLAPDPAAQDQWYIAGCGVLVVPMVTAGHVIGMLVAQDTNAAVSLHREKQSLVSSIASQAAIALQNAHLYNEIRGFNAELEHRIAERTHELQAERDRLETLYQIAIEVSSTLNLDKLLINSLDQLASLIGVDHGSIMLLDPETEHLVDRAVLGRNIVGFTRFPIGSGLAGWVAEQKRPVLVHDVSFDDRWLRRLSDEDENEIKRSGSIIAVPLLAQEQLLGVLMLSHDTIGFFNEDHLKLLNAIGSQIGVAVHNALLYDQIFTEVTRRGDLLRYQELEASKNAAILQSLSDGVVVCDTDGSVLLVNTAAERMLERSLSDLLSWNLRDMLHKLVASKLQPVEQLDDLLSAPLDADEQPRTLRSDFQIGPRTVSLTIGPVLTGKGELLGAVAVFRDMTREVESDRLKTEFIGTVSHELRTPMTSIKGYTQLLAMGSLGEINDTQREFLTTIQNNAERMISIINDLLDITKIETGSVELDIRPYPLAEILSSVVGDQRSAITAREHELTIGLSPGLPPVLGDSRRLHQILGNVLANAVKYTPRAGRIGIEAREVVSLDSLPLEVAESLQPNRRWIQIDISDTGVGIAPEEHYRVFERFYRTDNPLKIEAGGTGLGLSLVRSLVLLLGGRIWVRSTVNEGSMFSIVLPGV